MALLYTEMVDFITKFVDGKICLTDNSQQGDLFETKNVGSNTYEHTASTEASTVEKRTHLREMAVEVALS